MKNKRFTLVVPLMLVFSLFGAALPAMAQTDDDDGNWKEMESGTKEDLSGIWGSSSSDVFAVGLEGTILHYDGDTWEEMTSNTTNGLRGVWGSSSTDIFAVGGNGTIRHYDGSTWEEMNSGTTRYLYDVWGSSSSDVFAVGSKGVIQHYDSSTWEKETGSRVQSYIPQEDLVCVWGSSPDHILAVTFGTVRTYDDGNTRRLGTIMYYNGSNWRKMFSITKNFSDIRDAALFSDPMVSDVWCSSFSDVFAVGAECIIGDALKRERTIWHYDGSTWEAMTSNTAAKPPNTPSPTSAKTSTTVAAQGRSRRTSHCNPITAAAVPNT